MKAALAICLALFTLAPLSAAAQDCPPASQVKPHHLFGVWRAQVHGTAGEATLLLEKHPTDLDSVRGDIVRAGVRGLVAGEVEGIEFSMEESADGERIAATWVGEFVEGSCGREIRGTWQQDGTEKLFPFVMKKVPS